MGPNIFFKKNILYHFGTGIKLYLDPKKFTNITIVMFVFDVVIFSTLNTSTHWVNIIFTVVIKIMLPLFIIVKKWGFYKDIVIDILVESVMYYTEYNTLLIQ